MKIIAHRGNVSNEVDNRMEGLLQALENPVIDGIELDVHMTKDKKFILSHSEFLKEKEGLFDHIPSHTLKELQKKSYSLNGEIFPIITIDTFLKKVKTDKLIMIECKKDEWDFGKYGKAFLKTIKKYKKLNITICSFDYSLATFFKQKNKKYPVGLLIGYTINVLKEYDTFDYISVHYNSLHEKMKKKPYYIWTVDSLKKLESVKYNNNSIGIITNKGNIFHK